MHIASKRARCRLRQENGPARARADSRAAPRDAIALAPFLPQAPRARPIVSARKPNAVVDAGFGPLAGADPRRIWAGLQWRGTCFLRDECKTLNGESPRGGASSRGRPFVARMVGNANGGTNSTGAGDMRLKKQRGASVVEFAIVLPVMLLVIFGVVEFSLVMYDKAVVTNASREAARYGVVLSSPKYTAAQIQQIAANYCSTYLISLGSGSKTCPASGVNVTGAQGNFGSPLTVTVTYNFVPLALGKMVDPVTKTLTLSATTTMNNE
jgi:Flp pilus assembly protein TadG